MAAARPELARKPGQPSYPKSAVRGDCRALGESERLPPGISAVAEKGKITDIKDVESPHPQGRGVMVARQILTLLVGVRVPTPLLWFGSDADEGEVSEVPRARGVLAFQAGSFSLPGWFL